MRNKIFLFFGGLALAGGIFGTYVYFTGSDWRRNVKHVTDTQPVTLSGENDVRNPQFEFRDPNDMHLICVISAKVVHPTGKSHYDLEEPRIDFFYKGDLISITSKDGSVVVDKILNRETSDGKNKTDYVLRTGKLSNQVRITIGPKTSFIPNNTELQPEQVQVQFEKDIEFNYTDRTLESRGPVHIRGYQDWVTFDGRDLTALVNPEQKRVEYLRINPPEKGHCQLFVKDPYTVFKDRNKFPSETASSSSQTSQSSSGAMGTANSGSGKSTDTATATTQMNPDHIPTIYKLVLGSGPETGNLVRAIWGSRQMTAPEMSFIFQNSPHEVQNNTQEKQTATPISPEPAAVTPTAPSTTPTTTKKDDVANKYGLHQDLVVTWDGPLEMRPMPQAAVTAAKIKLVDNKDLIFQANSTRNRPVEIMDLSSATDSTEAPDFHVQAGRIWFQNATKVTHLDHGAWDYVEVISKRMGTLLQTPSISYDQESNIVTMTGPGRLETHTNALSSNTEKRDTTKKAKSDLVVTTWHNFLKAAVVEIADPSNPAKKIPSVDQVAISGNADIRHENFRAHGDTLQFKIANFIQPGTKHLTQDLSYLLATGNAVLEKIDPQRAQANARVDFIRAQRLEYLTQPNANEGGRPAPAALQASNDVVASMHQKGKHDPTHFLKSQITAPSMKIALGIKPKTDKDYAKESYLGSMVAKTMRAEGGLKIELEQESLKDGPIVAQAQSLDAIIGDDNNSTATLTGSAKYPAQLAYLQDKIGGQTILLDQKNSSVEIPGPGEATIVQVRKKKDTAKSETPIHITWGSRMKYDKASGIADFIGPIKTVALTKAEPGKPIIENELVANRLQVSFSTDSLKTNEEDKNPVLVRYLGQISARGSSINALTKKLETRMTLLNVNDLIYDDSKKSMAINGPGRLLLEDYRPEPAKKPGKGNNAMDSVSRRGQSAFEWSQALVYNGKSNEIRMLKDVKMVHKFADSIKLIEKVPAEKRKNPKVKELTDVVIDEVNVFGQILTVNLAESKNTTDSQSATDPANLGGNDGVKLARAVVQGNDQEQAVLTANKILISGSQLEYDAEKQKVAAIAGPKIPAHAESPIHGMLNARRQIVWDMTKDPLGDESFILDGAIIESR